MLVSRKIQHTAELDCFFIVRVPIRRDFIERSPVGPAASRAGGVFPFGLGRQTVMVAIVAGIQLRQKILRLAFADGFNWTIVPLFAATNQSERPPGA